MQGVYSVVGRIELPEDWSYNTYDRNVESLEDMGREKWRMV